MRDKTEQGGKKPKPKADRTARERRKNLTSEQIKELELAGGVEGGMQAGSAGGPGEETAAPPKNPAKR
ncbi:MAG TPA: hypothetical protein VE221_01350 [Sphingomicrobium sp.]|jgi:hypothetical protein|nr:hypothetical protein [Sphingomicrobium sp.]